MCAPVPSVLRTVHHYLHQHQRHRLSYRKYANLASQFYALLELCPASSTLTVLLLFSQWTHSVKRTCHPFSNSFSSNLLPADLFAAVLDWRWQLYTWADDADSHVALPVTHSVRDHLTQLTCRHQRLFVSLLLQQQSSAILVGMHLQTLKALPSTHSSSSNSDIIASNGPLGGGPIKRRKRKRSIVRARSLRQYKKELL